MSEQITRRNLPHWYVPNAAVFVTFRLAGTLPKHAVERLQHKKEQLLVQPDGDSSNVDHRRNIHKQLFLDYDRLLDSSRAFPWLSNPVVASVVRRSLWFHAGSTCHLLCYSIMPNHVHVLFRPYVEELADVERANEPVGESPTKLSPLAKIMHSIKSFTAHEINQILKRKGQVWQHESYDHWVRDDEEMERVVNYIDLNAPSAGLAQKPHEYFWCSAHDRFLRDGKRTGWLGEEGQQGS